MGPPSWQESKQWRLLSAAAGPRRLELRFFGRKAEPQPTQNAARRTCDLTMVSAGPGLPALSSPAGPGLQEPRPEPRCRPGLGAASGTIGASCRAHLASGRGTGASARRSDPLGLGVVPRAFRPHVPPAPCKLRVRRAGPVGLFLSSCQHLVCPSSLFLHALIERGKRRLHGEWPLRTPVCRTQVSPKRLCWGSAYVCLWPHG